MDQFDDSFAPWRDASYELAVDAINAMRIQGDHMIAQYATDGRS